MIHIRIAPAVALLLLAPATAVAQPAARAVDRAVAAYEKLNTLRAEFTQTITNPLTSTRLTARGEFVRRDPNLLAITFSDPAGDRIVADGEAVWVYLPSSAPGQVMKFSASNMAAARMDPASQFLTEPRTRFTISDAGIASVRGRTTRQVVLVPRQSNGAFTRARVWIDEQDSMIRQFEITEPSGLVRHVVITRLQPNVAVRPSVFDFTPPQGARVIDQTR
ncbi:MAG TPA: outer membrane lipoprotein chaperone LolA [Gemmatimonadaceae bacterium]|nr:outer membrane lipoprotein chaperone LolA [Gemmatimonadaceae bacterium]